MERAALRAVVFVFVIAISIEPSAIGIGGSGGGVDLARWAFLVPVYALPFLVTLRSNGVQRRLLGTTLSWIAALAAWTLAVAPFGASPLGDLVLAIGGVSIVLFAAHAVERLGVRTVIAAALAATFVLVVVSIGMPARSDGRSAGLYPAANALGIHGALIAVEGARRWLSSRHPIWLAPALIGLYATIAADSRTSMLAVGVGGLVLLRQVIPRWLVLLSFTGVLALLVIALQADLGTDVSLVVARSGEVEELSTFTGRTDVWAVSLDAIADRPVTGWGHNGGRDVYTAAFERNDTSFDAQEAHNLALQAGVNAGLPAVGLLFIGLAGTGVRIFRQNTGLEAAVFSVIVVHGLTEAVIREPKDLWFLIAALAAGSSDVGRRDATRS